MTTMFRPAMSLCLAALACAIGVEARAGFVYNGVAAGDMTSNDAILWTRGLDSSGPAATSLMAQVSTDPTFNSGTISYSASTDPSRDYTAKLDATGLQSGTRYYYRFETTGGVTSPVGTFMTAPDPTASVPLHFGFSGDADGQWRPDVHRVPGMEEPMPAPRSRCDPLIRQGNACGPEPGQGLCLMKMDGRNEGRGAGDFHRNAGSLGYRKPTKPVAEESDSCDQCRPRAINPSCRGFS
jgi:hypothetical protein